MTIKTKFEINQEVWFHYKDNQFIKGTIKFCQVNIPGQVTIYHIENPFFDQDLYRCQLNYEYLETKSEFSVRESEISATKAGIIEYITGIYQKNIDTISEIKMKKKKNWLGF